MSLNTLFPGSGSSGSANSYIGQVSTGARFMSAQATPNKQIMSRVRRVFRDTVPGGANGVKFRFSNWRITAGGGKVGLGATASIRAAIEYPAFSGNWYRLTSGGADPMPCADLANVWTDPLPFTVVDGTPFRFDVWFSNPNGIFYCLSNGQVDATAFGATTPDYTGGAGTVGTGPSLQYCFSACVGPTTKNAALIIDNSRGEGAQANTHQHVSDSGASSLALGQKLAYINASIQGHTVQGIRDNFAPYNEVLPYSTIVYGPDGVNDLGGASPAAIIAAQTTIGGLVGGRPYFVPTTGPYSTSSDGGVTQTPQNPTRTANITSYNKSLRQGLVPGVSGFIDRALVHEDPANPGCWLPLYFADGLHEASAGDIALASRGIITMPDARR